MAAQAPRRTLEDVAGRVRLDDDRAALRMIADLPEEVRETARVRYLRGRLLLRLDEHAGAADALDIPPRELPGPVAEDARHRRAQALVLAHRCADAMPLLDALRKGRSGAAARARASHAECLLRSDAHADAVAALRVVVREDAQGVDTFAVRLELAEALLRGGARRDAVAELRSLLVARPDHPDADRALEQLRALGGRFEPTPLERMDRAERFAKVRRHEDALRELDGPGPPADLTQRARWLHLEGMALFNTRQHYAEAARVLADAARQSSGTREEDQFHAARALSRADSDAQAVTAYRRFVREHPRAERAAEAEYLAAWLEIRQGRRAGEGNMRRFLDGPRARANRALAGEATWHLGFRAFEQGRHREAARWLERYAATGSEAMIAARGQYWLGRALMGQRDRAGAIAAWRRALAVEPLHWYALLARARLVEAGEDPGPPFPSPGGAREASAALPAPALPEEVAFFAAIGLRRDALAALRRREQDVRRAAPEGRGLEALALAYGTLGEASRPYRLVAIVEVAELDRRPDAANRWIWQAAYPRPFAAVLEPAARANGLEPEYLWAIMRQESGYDPEAVSYADAIGLLQMLPSSSERLARRLGVAFERDMLFDPAWNIRLAAKYNGGLHARFGGIAPLALAAFNAGAHNARRWLDDSGDIELDRFVERIPFDQTRNYVRRVTTHFARYRYMAHPDAGWPIDLPARVGPGVVRDPS